MSFGKNLRTLLEEHDMTQKELALQMNIAPSTMGSYVQDVREPDFDTLKRIAEFLGVSTDYLLDCHSGKIATPQENELLRIFRSLTPEQREICIEQCRVFIRANNKEKVVSAKSS